MTHESNNRETIRGLIAAAVLLAEHPELPKVTVELRVGSTSELTRDDMDRVAAVMDKELKGLHETPAMFSTALRAQVNDRVSVMALADRERLTGSEAGGPPPVILRECPQCHGAKVMGNGWSAATVPCDWCATDGEGPRGFMVPEPCPVSHEDFMDPDAGWMEEA